MRKRGYQKYITSFVWWCLADSWWLVVLERRIAGCSGSIKPTIRGIPCYWCNGHTSKEFDAFPASFKDQFSLWRRLRKFVHLWRKRCFNFAQKQRWSQMSDSNPKSWENDGGRIPLLSFTRIKASTDFGSQNSRTYPRRHYLVKLRADRVRVWQYDLSTRVAVNSPNFLLGWGTVACFLEWVVSIVERNKSTLSKLVYLWSCIQG